MGVLSAITRPVIVISNPVAGNGRGLRFGHRLVDILDDDGVDISWEITRERPSIRVEGLIDALRRSGSGEAPIVVVCAGDGTVAEVCQAIRTVQTDAYRPVLVPGPGGTAGDLRRELGVPNSPAGMRRFFSIAEPVDLDVVTASLDGGPERPVIHSFSAGASGGMFTRVAQMRQETGRVSVPIYLKALLAAMAAAEVFWVSIDGGPLISVGEVFTGVNSTSMGMVTRIPLPADGARVHAIPLDPRFPGPLRITPSLPTLLEAFRLGALYMAGDRTVISPEAPIGYLPGELMRDVMAGQSVRLAFFDSGGLRLQVPTVANGDPAGPASTVVIRHTGETIHALASGDSAYRIRRGHVLPTTLMQRMFPGDAPEDDQGGQASRRSLFGGITMSGDVSSSAAENDSGADDATAPPSIVPGAGVPSLFGGLPFIARAPLALP